MDNNVPVPPPEPQPTVKRPLRPITQLLISIAIVAVLASGASLSLLRDHRGRRWFDGRHLRTNARFRGKSLWRERLRLSQGEQWQGRHTELRYPPLEGAHRGVYGQ